MASDKENPPVPDPTVLTTEQLLREVENAKTILLSEIRSVESSCNEKFLNTKNQFGLVETQRVEQKKDTKDAVDAALTAQKEAVKEQTKTTTDQIEKSERGTKEQLNQLTTTFKTEIGAVTGILNDVKDRVQRMEAINQGRNELRTDNRATVSNTTAIIASIFGAILLLMALYTFSRSNQSVRTPQIVTVTVPTSTP